MNYDVIIVGAGPAGIFAALELQKHNNNLKILIVEKGVPIDRRICPLTKLSPGCTQCPVCHILSGWGGAGAFSDGKLTLSTQVGGWLSDIIGEEKLAQLMKYVDDIYVEYGAPKEVSGTDKDKIAEIEAKARLADLHLIPMQVRHMGREVSTKVLKKMYDTIKEKVDVKFRTSVKHLVVENGKIVGIETDKGEIINAKYVIVGPGRVGAEWFAKEGKRLGLKMINNYVDIGVRVEIPAEVMEELANALYEPKLIYYTKKFDDKVRLFCFNPRGEVTTEFYDTILSVNGQSWAEKKTPNTNFALLVSTSFTEPFNEPIRYGKSIAGLANMLSGGILVQRLGDLRRGRRSTPERIKRSVVKPTLTSAKPGDLSFALPYRYLEDILEMIDALDKIAPGVADDGTLLYGVEVKFYSSRMKINENLESEIKNLFTIGDGAGVTRGLIQASISGVIAAKAIIERELNQS